MAMTTATTRQATDDAYGKQGSPQIGIKGGDPVVIVADILSTDPTKVLKGPAGSEVALPANAPSVVEKKDSMMPTNRPNHMPLSAPESATRGYVNLPVTRSTIFKSLPTIETICTGNCWSAR